MALARDVRADSPAAGLAGVRLARRGGRLRAVEGRAPADRGRVPPRGLRDARRARSGPTPGARNRPTRRAATSTSSARIPFRSARARRGPAPGASTTSSATAGSGRRPCSRASRASSRCRPIPVYSADFFDGKHFVMKGASPVDGEGAAAPQLPQLVPRQLSLRLRDVSVREPMTLPERVAAPAEGAGPGLRGRTSAAICSSPRGSSSRSTSTTRSGSALFEAICLLPWYRITRAEGRLLSRCGGEMVSGVDGPVTLVELGCGSGEKVSLIARELRKRQRPIAVHLIDISPAALELSEKNLGGIEHVSVVGHRATYEEGLRRAARERAPGSTLLVLFLGSNIGNFDPPHSEEFLRGDPAGAAAGRRAAARRRSRQARGGAAPRLRRSARRHGRVQQESPSPDQHGAPRRLRPRRLRPPRRLEPPRAPRRDAPRLPARPGGRHPARGLRPRLAGGRDHLDRELLQVRAGGGHRPRDAARASAPAQQWIEPDARFALTLFVAIERASGPLFLRVLAWACPPW